MRFLTLAACVAAAFSATLAVAAPPPAAPTPAANSAAPQAPASTAKYTTSTSQMSTLMADPAAKAVLVKHVPDLVKNDDILERAGGMTLKELQAVIQTYSPDVLSDAVLARIDADLAQSK